MQLPVPDGINQTRQVTQQAWRLEAGEVTPALAGGLHALQTTLVVAGAGRVIAEGSPDGALWLPLLDLRAPTTGVLPARTEQWRVRALSGPVTVTVFQTAALR